MLRFLKSRRLRHALIGLVLVLAVLIGLAVLLWPYLSVLGDREATKQMIADAGPWAPLVFMAMQVMQVIFAPIPGQIVGFVGGYLFGTLWGTVYGMIGTTVGFAIVFTLSRRLGRPFVEYFVPRKYLEKFDYLAETKGIWVLFLVFLLPVLPDAMLGYIAGLTTIKIRTLLIVSFIGRLPSIFVLSMAGSQTADANYVFVGVIFTVCALLLGIAYLKRRPLERWIQRLAHKD